VETALFARDALHDKARVFINQNAQRCLLLKVLFSYSE